jgi:hypothetical protein
LSHGPPTPLILSSTILKVTHPTPPMLQA